MVLIVDDEIEIVENLVELLKASSYQAVGTSNAQEALELATTGKFHCIIADIAMPKLNGIELLKQLKKSRPEIATISMSAYSIMMREDLNLLGVDAVFEKPFHPVEMVETVKRLLGASNL